MELLSRVRLFATPRTVAYQAPPSMGFSRQDYWSGLPFPSPGDIPNPGIKPESPSLQTGALPSEPPGKPLLMEVLINYYYPHLKEESQLAGGTGLGSPILVNRTQLPTASLSQNFSQNDCIL